MKTCTKCGVEKPVTEFTARKTAHDGLNYWCKACKAQRSAAHYIANKRKVIEATRKWKLAHPPRPAWLSRDAQKEQEEQNGLRKINPAKWGYAPADAVK